MDLTNIERGEKNLLSNSIILQVVIYVCAPVEVSFSSNIRSFFSETYFLIAKFLEDGPCKETAEVSLVYSSRFRNFVASARSKFCFSS